jgi:hypothetical protein
MTFLQTYKKYIIGSIIDLVLAIILVYMFRSSYSEDSFISDVVLYFVVIAVITIILGIKNGLVTYLLVLFVGEDDIELIVKNLVDFNLPKPSVLFDIDNPEDYFNDVVNNESESTKARMLAIGVTTIYSYLRSHSKFVNLYLYSKTMKEALRRYLKICESYE